MSEWRALSFSQPWLDYVMRAARGDRDPKLVENRRWNTKHRGPFLLHAAKSYDQEAGDWAELNGLNRVVSATTLPEGGFVGIAQLVWVFRPRAEIPHDLVTPYSAQRFNEQDWRWWMRDQFGFLLANVRSTPFRQHRGALGFWKVPPRTIADMGLPPTPEEWVP